MAKHIFISYNHEDLQQMQRVKLFLDQIYGLPIWTDEGIEPDTPSWLSTVQQSIMDAYCVLCILTPNTRLSEWVMEELFFARTNKISIYMVMVAGDLQSSSIFGFSASQVTDLTNPDNHDERLKTLAEDIKRKHIVSTRDTAAPSSATLKKVNAAIRENEEKQKIDIPAHELHMLIVRQETTATPQTRFRITDTPCLLGRDETNTIIVHDTYISRNHCDFLYTADGMWIRDLDSSNGTYVDGRRVTGKYLLKNGDQITFAHPGLKRTIELTYLVVFDFQDSGDNLLDSQKPITQRLDSTLIDSGSPIQISDFGLDNSVSPITQGMDRVEDDSEDH